MRSKRYLAREAAGRASRTVAAEVAAAESVVESPISSSRKKKPALPWVFVGVLLVAVATAFVFRQAEVMAVQKTLAAMQTEIEQYTSLNESLAKQIEALKSDDYIEKAAREKLGLVMPGEVQYMVITYNGKN
jgi:cell division protein FtsL